jgi:hypothetical protein
MPTNYVSVGFVKHAISHIKKNHNVVCVHVNLQLLLHDQMFTIQQINFGTDCHVNVINVALYRPK